MVKYQLKINKKAEEGISDIVSNLSVKVGVRFKKGKVIETALNMLKNISSKGSKGYSLHLYNLEKKKVQNEVDYLPETSKLERGLMKQCISKIPGMKGIGMKQYDLILNEKAEEGISDIIDDLYVKSGVRLEKGEVIRHALIMLEYASSMANKGYSLVLYDPKTNKVHQEIVF